MRAKTAGVMDGGGAGAGGAGAGGPEPPWAIADEALAGWLRRSLREVERTLRSAVRFPRDDRLAGAATHLLDAGGRRLRPALVLLSGWFADPDRAEVRRAAAVVELVHLASLHHDDVMDGAPLRRGVPSVNAQWGNRTAILVGDYLVARAAELGAPLGADAVADLAHTLSRLVEGQFRETLGVPAAGDPEEYYREVVAGKTAALFGLAARLGARASGADGPVTRTLGAYAEALGTAFQLCDDLRDLLVPGAGTGKLEAADLAAGVLTLPVLRARAAAGAPAARLRRLLTRGPVTDPHRRELAATLIRQTTAIEQTGAEIEVWIGTARRALRALPATPASEALSGLCDFVRTGAEAGETPEGAGR